jgi:membrane protein DedA with SNARE-associated domain
MDQLIDFLYQMAPYAHFIAFGMLMLSGLSVPISEDVVIIISASIPATLQPDNAVLIFAGCFLGALFSDWIPYSIGRFGGPKILSIPFFARNLPRHKIEKIENYFHRYHVKTLFFGRFIPFGVRNALFFTAGLLKVKFFKFLLIDFCALVITASIQFTIGYTLGENFRSIFPYLDRYKLVIFVLFLSIIAAVVIKRRFFSSEK